MRLFSSLVKVCVVSYLGSGGVRRTGCVCEEDVSGWGCERGRVELWEGVSDSGKRVEECRGGGGGGGALRTQRKRGRGKERSGRDGRGGTKRRGRMHGVMKFTGKEKRQVRERTRGHERGK